MEKLSIFLSHLTVESKLADTLKGHLSHDFIGLVDVFVSSDRTSIPAGAKWLSEVNSALELLPFTWFCVAANLLVNGYNLRQAPPRLEDTVVPICHSRLPAQLPVPLSEWEALKQPLPTESESLRIWPRSGFRVSQMSTLSYMPELPRSSTVPRAVCTTIWGQRCAAEYKSLNPRVVCVSVAVSELDFKISLRSYWKRSG